MLELYLLVLVVLELRLLLCVLSMVDNQRSRLLVGFCSAISDLLKKYTEHQKKQLPQVKFDFPLSADLQI